jgi:hypothetical protein
VERSLRDCHDIDGYVHLLRRSGSDQDTPDGRDIAVVATPGHGDVAVNDDFRRRTPRERFE